MRMTIINSHKLHTSALAEDRSLFLNWLVNLLRLALQLSAALLLAVCLLYLTARAQEQPAHERNAGQAQSATYRVATQAVTGGGGAAKSKSYQTITAIAQQAAAGLVKGSQFQLELGVLTSDDTSGNQPTIVSAATYKAPVAPGSIAVAFGVRLATADAAAAMLPLPLTLAGTTVRVNGRPSRLFYVGDDAPAGYGQVNFLIPPETETGMAEVVITAADGLISLAHVQVAPVAPGLFTADATGSGEAAALATPDGIRYFTAPFDLTVEGNPNYLILFGTGIRNVSRPDRVQVTIDDVPAQVVYAGAHSTLVGLDQINVIIPQQLRSRGAVNVTLVVEGIPASTVQVRLR
jgi:uncharacterized protein (TIGR03437 family)